MLNGVIIIITGNVGSQNCQNIFFLNASHIFILIVKWSYENTEADDTAIIHVLWIQIYVNRTSSLFWAEIIQSLVYSKLDFQSLSLTCWMFKHYKTVMIKAETVHGQYILIKKYACLFKIHLGLRFSKVLIYIFPIPIFL